MHLPQEKASFRRSKRLPWAYCVIEAPFLLWVVSALEKPETVFELRRVEVLDRLTTVAPGNVQGD